VRALLGRIALGVLLADALRSGAAAMTPGTPVPQVTVTTLSGRNLTFPLANAAAPTVLIVGFSNESAPLCQAWGERLVRGHDLPRSRIFAVPVVEGVPKIARGVVLSAIRKSTAAVGQDNVIPLFDRSWPPIAALSVNGQPDVIVLGRTGIILDVVAGPLDDERYHRVQAALLRES
jgi:hypothetical protein